MSPTSNSGDLEEKIYWIIDRSKGYGYPLTAHQAKDAILALIQEETRKAQNRGYNTGFQKASRIVKRDSKTSIQLREIADKIDSDLQQLNQSESSSDV